MDSIAYGFGIAATFVAAGTIVCARFCDTVMHKRRIKHLHVEMSDKQYDVLEFLSKIFDTVFLNETDHDDFHFTYLVTDKYFGKRINTIGYHKMCVEYPVVRQEWFDAAREGILPRSELIKRLIIANRGWPSGGMARLHAERRTTIICDKVLWLQAINARVNLHDKFLERASPTALRIANSVNFVMRFLFPKMWAGKFMLNRVFYSERVSKEINEFTQAYRDDTETAKVVLRKVAQGELCMIAYGSGHSNGSHRDWNVADLRDELEKYGRKPVVINTYYSTSGYGSSIDSDRRRQEQGRYVRPAEIEFFFDTENGGPWVFFNDKHLEAEFYKAYPKYLPRNMAHLSAIASTPGPQVN